jgi:ribosomal protein S18 acetylase RimI-like enzyme
VSELDNPVWWAITGSQHELATATSLAARFDPDVSPFGAFSEEPTPDHWGDLARLVGPGGMVALTGVIGRPPDDWRVLMSIPGVQMVGEQVSPNPGTHPTAESAPDQPQPLGEEDVPDMLALVTEAQPGPFLARTVEFGGYLGVRRRGRLVAMAGERLRPPGFAEISAVATATDHRHQGLGELLVRAVMASVLARGEMPFLHASSENTVAVRLYERLGFTRRREVSFLVLVAPS